jgi:hypothetical protein
MRQQIEDFADWFEDAPIWAYCLVAAFCGTMTAIIMETVGTCLVYFLE